MIGKTGRQTWVLLLLGLQGLRQKMLRVVTSVLGAMGVVAVMVGLLSVSEGYSRMTNSDIDPGIVRLLMEGANSEIASSIDISELSIIRKFSDVMVAAEGQPKVSAEILTTVKLRSKSGPEINVPLRGVEQPSYELSGVAVVQGRLPANGRRELVVGEMLLARLEGLTLGSEVDIANSKWRIVGVFTATTRVLESELWTSTGVLASSMNQGRYVQTALLQLKEGASVTGFANAIDNDPRLSVHVISQKDYLEKQSDSVREFLHTLGYGIPLLMALAAGFAALVTGQAAVSSRLKEIVTVKALGFRNSAVLVSFVAESLLLSIIGGAMGAAAAYLAFDGLEAATSLRSANYTAVAFTFDVSPWVLAQSMFLAVLIGLGGSLYPACHASSRPISSAIDGRL